MSKHTPGPWFATQNGSAFNLNSPDRASHFAILLGMLSNSDGELDANARLIAAAPELLEALKALKRMPIPMPRTEQARKDIAAYWAVVDAVIAKAEDQDT